MRSYGVEKFEIKILQTFNTKKELEQAEYDTIRRLRDEGANLYNILDGGTSYFPIKDKDAWRAKLRKARVGRKPSLGMKHTDENKKFFAKVSRKYWDTQDTYDGEEIVKYPLTQAMEKFGISKTHYYRFKRKSNKIVQNP